MSRASVCLSVALLLVAVAVTWSAGPPVQITPPTVPVAINRAMPLLVSGARGHIVKRSCFACHNQAIAMLAWTVARDRGFTVRDSDIQEQMRFISDFLTRNRENFRQGKGTGGQVDTAGYALLTLEWGGWKADATTAAVAEYLLLRNKDADHWTVSGNRPPSEASPLTTTYLALRGLKKWGTAEQQTRIASRTQKVRAWLRKTPAKDTEDRVFRLLALREAGVEEKELKNAARELIGTQREDGGWSQIPRLPGDAYATGSALVALHQAGGLSTRDRVYQRGVTFLLKNQLPDGSWFVRSRSNPFQAYYESGFPHGKDQFISMAASSWAVAALALSVEAR